MSRPNDVGINDFDSAVNPTEMRLRREAGLATWLKNREISEVVLNLCVRVHVHVS